MQILQFYEGFQFSFERNLILTYNLRRHFSFKKIEDHELEKKIEGARHQERLEEMSNDHPVRKILKGFPYFNFYFQKNVFEDMVFTIISDSKTSVYVKRCIDLKNEHAKID